MIRAKFQCSKVTQHAGWDGRTHNGLGIREISFRAVCADEVPENQRFHEATPAGDITITVTNKECVFEPGKSYYVDFTETSP